MEQVGGAAMLITVTSRKKPRCKICKHGPLTLSKVCRVGDVTCRVCQTTFK